MPPPPQTDIERVSILGKESIHCGFHLIPYIAHTVLTTLPSSTYVLITDTNVAKHFLTHFEDEFARALNDFKGDVRFLVHVIAPGETSKSREGKADIEDFLLSSACTRDTVILALGGGVIGDLVGFVAATFMRGVRFVQIPTTLLAMVDSSVGGKTAIDTPAGKNLIGAFWQPEYVFIDAAFLETLPTREFSNGMAEVVKTAAIWDESEFNALESRSEELFAAIQTPSVSFAGRTLSTRSEQQRLLLRVIRASVGVKAHIVTVDERETGLRNLVNFGHTIGHALEAVLTPAILHGECVAVGMVLEAELARARGVLGQVAVGRLARCLQAYGLPTSVSDPRIASAPGAPLISVPRLLDVMRVDKKNAGRGIKVVLLQRLGKTLEERATVVPDAAIARVLSDAVTVVSAIPTKSPVKMATPGSKSISNRALVLAALGKGTCRLTNLLHSDDTKVMMAALQDLQGARFEWEDGGETLVVHGGGGSLIAPSSGKELYLGNAGTAARFLTTVCTLASSSSGANTTVVTGNARMKQRPIGPLVDALRTNGVEVEYRESQGCLPLAIGAGGFKGGKIELAASVSSQYVSSVLLCAPYARDAAVELELVGGQVISQPYIDMTLAMMADFGVSVDRVSETRYRIPQGTYVNPAEYAIESDASSATYPLAIAAISGTQCTLSNIGTRSLQGDARFAKDVLEPMGCEVVQTEYETTVRGPPVGTLKALGLIDMEPMTDAFLTAAVLAAVAASPPKEGRELKDGSRPTTTRIIGIANQRVKECNRIQAMIDQLAKFGIETKELDDGLEVYGRPLEELKHGASIHCYDDHRVAMAHSVLATVVPGTIIEEKRCVEKTWPNWWDDLENKIGVKVEGIDLSGHHPHSVASVSGTVDGPSGSASVIIIGMRGSGKTFIGELAASTLGWQCIDADAYFEQKFQIGVRQFVHEKGWDEFRAAELEVLNELMTRHPNQHIISLGGGIVETPAARDMLVKYKNSGAPIVHIVREIDEVVQYLGQETARPAYGEPIEDVFARRAPWFAECCNFEFINHVGSLAGSAEETFGSVHAEVSRFFGHITGQKSNQAANLGSGERSYFLSLTFPDITPALQYMEELTAGADAIELRVDLLRAPKDMDHTGPYVPPRAYVADQIALLRRHTSLPIVYTVRTISQGGSFPDKQDKESFDLLDLALRLAVEYIDVEITWPEKSITGLKRRKGATQIISSWHDWSGGFKWDSAVAKEKRAIAEKFGDIVKMVGKANSLEDNFALHKFVSLRNSDSKPIIAINMGVEGQMSRILNATLSPITHPLLPSKAAPGQLSFAQIQTALHLIGQLPSRKFYLFGTPIAHSMSPTLHNTAFSLLGLPHTYELLETSTFDDPKIHAVIRSPDFGGASVTIPFKKNVLSVIDILSPEAEVIGAVNTIIPVFAKVDGSYTLRGDNTDWRGIHDVIRPRLSAGMRSIGASLVIGGGGTARAAVFALHKLGSKRIYIYNRTATRAKEIIDSFAKHGISVEPVDTISGSWPGAAPQVIVGTVPASATTTEAAIDALHISGSLFTGAESGVVVDMAYKPAMTPLLEVAKSVGGWTTVRGVDVLLAQGFEQFRLWTGRRCSTQAVTQTVLAKYDSQ